MLNLKPRPDKGFSLVELLLVLAIIGILGGIAIPTFMGQRRRARVIGDAKANAAAIMQQMEARKAEAGVYAANGKTVTWTNGVPSSAAFFPNFSMKGGTQMNYSLVVTNSGVGYTLTVTDPRVNATVLTADQTGTINTSYAYNK